MFETPDYKAIIVQFLDMNSKIKGYRRQLTDAMGVHTSFLSQVLHSHIHITPDHAASLAEFWGLTEEESEYFIALVSLARSSSKAYSKYLASRIKQIQKNRRDISQRVKSRQSLEREHEKAQVYYSAWYMAAIHVLLSVPGFDHAEAIAQRLSLPTQIVTQALTMLENIGMIARQDQKYKVINHDVHISAKSMLVNAHHSHWRSYVTHHLPMQKKDEAVHYTSLLGISRSDFERIREIMLSAIAKSRQVAVDSQEEDLYGLCIDLFKV